MSLALPPSGGASPASPFGDGQSRCRLNYDDLVFNIISTSRLYQTFFICDFFMQKLMHFWILIPSCPVDFYSFLLNKSQIDNSKLSFLFALKLSILLDSNKFQNIDFDSFTFITVCTWLQTCFPLSTIKKYNGTTVFKQSSFQKTSCSQMHTTMALSPAFLTGL